MLHLTMAKFDQIENYLKQKGVGYKVINLPDTAVSVEDVVRLTNGQIREEEIIKTLIVKNKQGEFIACVLQGKDRLKREVMERLATKEEVFQIAGVEIGAVCPILLGIPLLIDTKVARLQRVNMGSGDHLKGLEMDFEGLLKSLQDFRIEEISI